MSIDPISSTKALETLTGHEHLGSEAADAWQQRFHQGTPLPR